MATEAQRARRRAQRATAARVRNKQTILPKSITGGVSRARVQWATDVYEGRIPEPSPGTPEARQLARMASLARWNKADPKFAVFEKYFYRNKEQNMGPEAQTYEEGNTADVEDDEGE